MDETCTITEAATLLGISPARVCQLIQRRRLPLVSRTFYHRTIPRAAVEARLAAAPGPGRPKLVVENETQVSLVE